MGLNETPSANRTHIAFLGCRNVGKSSLVNAVTGQELAVVSDTKGTTTDPVKKSMELLPLGPVVIIDTPGFDDEGELGEKRIKKTRQILNQADLAVLVLDCNVKVTEADRELVQIFLEKEIPYVIACNKCDLKPQKDPRDFVMEWPDKNEKSPDEEKVIFVSARDGYHIHELKEKIARLVKEEKKRYLVADLIEPGDFVVLVTPIDESAPKGRMILPQQQMIRDVLDAGAINIVTKETELEQSLKGLSKKPAMVITDSQAFRVVSQIVPQEIPLTSFSILMARYKGFLETAVEGIAALRKLKDQDLVLIAEGCTHHRQCNDIGTVKLPGWLRTYTGKNLRFAFCSGTEFPEDLSSYAAVVHCGACMLNEREVLSRMKKAVSQNVPFTNYGTVIAAVTGTLERSLGVIPGMEDRLK